jgi:hypothetical protein
MPINIAIGEVSQLVEKNFLQIQVCPYIFPSSCQAQDGRISIYWCHKKGYGICAGVVLQSFLLIVIMIINIS